MFSIAGQTLKLNSAKDVQDICQNILDTKDLTEIRLSGNTFGVEACQAIAQTLVHQPKLTMIGFSDMFTGRLKNEIPLALEAFVEVLLEKDIQELDLSDNAFGPAGAKPLMKLLQENPRIRILKLNNNGLGIEGGRLISSALVQAKETHGEACQLQVLQMGRNRLESQGAEFVSRAIEAHSSTLKVVRLYQNSIRPDVFPTLMECLGKCHGLEELDLQDNTLTETGSKALASVVSNWSLLKKLNLGECLTRAKGASLVIQALTGNHVHLKQLHLSFNEMDLEGALLIPKLLENKKELCLLELNGNEFDPEHSVVEDIRCILRSHGHPDALDELDEMDFEGSEDDDSCASSEGSVKKTVQEDEQVDQLALKLAQVSSF